MPAERTVFQTYCLIVLSIFAAYSFQAAFADYQQKHMIVKQGSLSDYAE